MHTGDSPKWVKSKRRRRFGCCMAAPLILFGCSVAASCFGSIQILNFTPGENESGSIQIFTFTPGKNESGSIQIFIFTLEKNESGSIQIFIFTLRKNESGSIQILIFKLGKKGIWIDPDINFYS